MDVRVLQRIVITGFMVTLSACATTTTPTQSKTSETPKDGLSARQLANGECGLFVWTAGAERRFILFGQSQKASAVWASDANEILLRVQSQSGSAVQGQFPKQVFISESADQLDLDLREPQSIENGTRYRAGTLTQTAADGWNRVTPVVGLSACKPINKAS
jgi:hypothetical protein